MMRRVANQTNLKLQDRLQQAQYFVAGRTRWWLRALSAVEKFKRSKSRDDHVTLDAPFDATNA